jgi:hypothetical protein
LNARLPHREVVRERYQEDLTLHDPARWHLDADRLPGPRRSHLCLKDITLRECAGGDDVNLDGDVLGRTVVALL